MAKNTPKKIIAAFSRNQMQAVVHLKEAPYDGFEYPAIKAQRIPLTKSGKPGSPQDDFFDYNVDDLFLAVKEARSFIKSYQQNPKAALAKLDRAQADANQIAA